MPVKIIPEDVRNFILQNIDSIAQLEGLLLLRADTATSWDIPSLSKRLYVTDTEAEKLVAALCTRGLFKAEEKTPLRYRYAPKNPDLADKVAKLAELYAHYLVPITTLVHEKSNNKVREFADAFWIRKE
jgi:hypothetical protein